MRRRIREWSESPYRFIKSKEVRDDDGFLTDYTWWYDERDGVHFFMFGDRDIYRPNRDYADWECDSYEEAEEWFWNYGTEQYVDDRGWYDESLKEDVSLSLVKELVDDYRENAFGYDGIKDYVEVQYPRHPKEFKTELVKKMKKAMNESFKRARLNNAKWRTRK